MSPRSLRLLLRCVHVALGVLIAASVYVPLLWWEAMRPVLAWAVVPTAVLAGIAIWHQPRLNRLLRRSRTAGSSDPSPGIPLLDDPLPDDLLLDDPSPGEPAVCQQTRMPSNARLGAIFGVLLAGALTAQVNLQWTFAQVDHAVSLFQASIEGDATVLRGWYAQLVEQDTYLGMIRTELVDLPWAIVLGCTLVALYRLVGGLLRNLHPTISTWMFRYAPLAAIGPALDLVENAFSLAMLTDPFTFPDWWASAHGAASVAKLAGSIAAATVGPTLTLIAVARPQRSRQPVSSLR